MPQHPFAPARIPPPARRAAQGAMAVGAAVRPEDLVAALADRPYPVMTSYLGTTLVAADPIEVVTGTAVWDALDITVRSTTTVPSGAWLGYLGYDLGTRERRAAPPQSAHHHPPVAVLCRYRAIAQIAPGGCCRILGEGPDARRLAAIADAVVPLPAAVVRRRTQPPAASLDARAYAERAAEIIRRIRAGDCSEVNLVQRLSAVWDGDAVAFADRLWTAAGPASHRAYFATPDGTLVSASPERLVAVRDAVAVSAPIKGTAALGRGAALVNSAKDRAEHVMIVDLVRNDLGRVARIGGVSVPRLLVPLTTGYVEHLVSEVRAELAAGVRVSEVLGALFPAGSITGCPKLAAMRVIAELEPVPRGPAFGSMVAVGVDGGIEASVLIRTAWLHDGRVSYWSGGAVTWDSDPAAEHAEAMVKARPFLEAIGCG
jgi:anthranilate/para-aminobenzoate synthase component I